jgi:hypothetical protein
MAYWHAYAERNGKRLAGSDIDAIEAETPDSAARRATRFYWIERRHLFDHSDAKVRAIVIVVAPQIPVDRNRDNTTPSLGTPTRWASKVTVMHQEPYLDAERDFDHTQLAAIEVEPLPL